MKNILRNSNFGFTKWCLALIAAALGMSGAAQAQQSINSGSTVTVDFNSIGSSSTATLPTGWKMGTDWSTGVTATTQAAGTTGTGVVSSSSSGGFFNWANGVTAATTDRALGFLTSGSFSSPRTIIYAFQNNTGGAVTALTLTWNYEKYRSGSRAFAWTFFHGDTPTATTAATTGDQAYGADAANTTVFNPPQAVAKTVTISGLNIPTGGIYYLRWTYTGSGGNTNAQGLALDDLTITLTTSSGGTPPTITGISPSSGLADTIVTITGTDFTGATAVSFNGVAAASYTVDSATSITATAPTGVTTGPISVTTPGGTAASSGNFTVPALAITVPSSINEGDSSQIATVTATPAPTSDLTITLTSSSATDLTVDGGSGAGATSTATIAANTTEASFFLNAPADSTVDNDASVNLTATAASGYRGATAIVTVRNVDFNPPTIVVNKSYNSGGANGADDVVELLVIGNGTPGSTINLQGMILKDYSSSAGSDGGGAYIFANDPLWSSVKAGTLIVLTKPGTTPPAEDVDSSDFVIKVNLSNVTYFTVGTGVFDVGGTELIQIKASGSAQAGSAGVIHSLAIGTSSAAQVAAAPAPKLICFNSGNNPFAISSTKTLADFNGTGAAQSASPLGMGIPNNTDNATYIAGLRGSKDITISIDPSIAIIKEDAGLQAGKITVALSEVTNSDLSVTLSVTPSGVATIPDSVVIPSGASSVTIDFTPINDGVIGGNRTVTISGSSSGWNSGNNTATVVDIQFNNPSVVINEVLNGGTGVADAAELLVVENNLNMVGMILKDFSTNMTGDAGRQFTFADNALWQSVKAGTLLVLTSDAAATEDTDASDGIVIIQLTNATYFTASGGTFDISNTDMVMIKASGSGTSGITGAIHTFGNGPAGSLFNLANGAKLLFAAGGGGGGADNATSAIVDYNGTGVTGGTVTLGAANNANNQAYITTLRDSAGPIAPSSLSYTPSSISGTVEVAISSLTPTVTGTVDTYSVSPALPSGLSINASSGVISGTPTTIAASASYTVTASNSGGSTTAAVTVEVVKGTPSITVVPTASAITDGQALSGSVLIGGTASVEGAFDWTAPSEVPAVGTVSYGVTFTPTDTANYNTATTTVSLTVNPAGTTYSGWLNGAGASDAAFLDYVFGAVTPGTLDPSLRPTVAVTGGNLVLTYYERQGTAGLTVTPKTSADLAAGPSGWVTDDVTVDNVGTATTVNGVSVQQKTASVPVSGAKKFLRVEAVQE
jgi:hypothetical protein